MQIKVTPTAERLLGELFTAHHRGEFEVPLGKLASSIAMTEDDVRTEILALLHAGIVERLDDPRMVALSVLGLRIAREVERATTSAAPEAAQGQSFSATDVSFSTIIQHWSDVVRASNLTETEKERLLQLGKDFLSHPATPELWRRAVSRTEHGKMPTDSGPSE